MCHQNPQESPLPARCWSTTAIAGSASTGRATGRSSRATSVDYRPYQEVAAQYPAIPLADFQRAVQYITPDGQLASAAEASFLVLSHARGKGIWLTLYRRLPGFAAISELSLRLHRRAPLGLLSHQPVVLGQGLRTAAIRSRLHSCSCACSG